MPRSPTYRRHASGRGRTQFKGKTIYFPGPFGSVESKLAFERFIDEIQIEKIVAARKARQAKTPPSLRNVRIAELLADYLDHAKVYYGGKRTARGATEYSAMRLSVKPLFRLYGDRRVEEFGPLALAAVREAMIAAGWSRQYCNSCVNRIKRVFRWGVGQELVAAETLLALQAIAPLQKGHTLAPERQPVLPVAWCDVEAVRPFVTPMLWSMIELQWLTGMRSDELTGLQNVEVDRHGDVWTYKPRKHKTAHRGKAKVVCFGPKAQAIIERYTGLALDAFLFTPAAAARERAQARRRSAVAPAKGRLKVRRDLRPRYFATSYRQAIAHAFKRAEAAGLELVRWHPHQLRHSRATLTREAYGVEGAQAQIGNTLEATQLYAERSLKLAQEIARATG